MQKRVVADLMEFEFTNNEAKIYLALLKKQPATGYELASSSGVPRSAVYGILKRLSSRGIINAIQENPTRYVGLAPEKLCSMLKDRFENTLGSLESSLDKWSSPSQVSNIWQFHDRRAIMGHAQQLIASAESFVAASIWESDARELHDCLTEAANRKVELLHFSFTELPDLPGTVYCYGIPEDKLNQHWDKQLCLIVDNTSTLIARTGRDGSAHGLVTDAPLQVDIATSNMVLDLTLFGSRTGHPTEDAVRKVVSEMAPIDDLLKAGKPRFQPAPAPTRRKKTRKKK